MKIEKLENLKMQIGEHVDLKPYNSFGIAAKARYFAAFGRVEALGAVLDDAALARNVLVLGGGSNILLTKDFDGLVLKNNIGGIEIVGEDEAEVLVKAGGGESWHRLVMYGVERNYGGMENLSLIPGSVGASPMQNIGAYGVEIKDVFHELEAFDREDRTMRPFGPGDCEFGYRESVFKNRYRGRFIITSVTYRLQKQPRFNTSYGAIAQELEKMGVQTLTVGAVSQAVINIRSSKLPDPKAVGNAGSFFKNPQVTDAHFLQLKEQFPAIVGFPVNDGHTKLAAGWLIEQCGWKGYRRGDAGCYEKQALVLVNFGSARGSEIFSLSEDIIASVQEKFGVALQREVNIY